MIKTGSGNVLEAHAEALVNTVNCVGFMGKGIALQFKQAYPENFEAYQRACRSEEVRPGHMFIFPRGAMLDVKYIVNFPTKRHWKGNSRYEDIEAGLKALIEQNYDAPSKRFADKIITTASKYYGGKGTDDMSLLLLDVRKCARAAK